MGLAAKEGRQGQLLRRASVAFEERSLQHLVACGKRWPLEDPLLLPQPPKGKVSERAGEENGVACGERSTRYKRKCQGAAVGAALVRD